MFALFCVFLLFIGGIDSWKVYKKRDDQVEQIQPPVQTDFGEWGPNEYCAPGTYAHGFSMNVGHKGSDDKTGVNGITLYCRPIIKDENDKIESYQKKWGHWENKVECPGKSYLTGASIKSQKHKWWLLRRDDTAVNNFRFECQDGSKIEGVGGSDGTWGTQANCPANSAICGIKTKVEGCPAIQSLCNSKLVDHTTLNKAIFYCCSIKNGSV